MDPPRNTRERHDDVAVVATVSTVTKAHTRRDRGEPAAPELETNNSHTVVAALSEQLLHISFGEPHVGPRNALPAITSSRQLENEVSLLCNQAFKVLGPYNLEATYQRALALELRDRGVPVLSEVEIPIEYKGQRIATRRVDLYLKLDKPVIFELKAVVTGLKTDHLKQLEFYMTHFQGSEGYLINFPHLTGFPEQHDALYVKHVLQPEGGVGVSDRVTRSSTPRKNMMPTIIHVQQIKTAKKTTVNKSTIHTNSRIEEPSATVGATRTNRCA